MALSERGTRVCRHLNALAVAAALALATCLSSTASARQLHFVWRLAFIDVQFHPTDSRILLVVASNGDINLLDISGAGRPVKQLGIEADAVTASFNPAGDRIVSAGRDGIVRLWTLGGKPAAEPFTEHVGGVLSAAFDPAGNRIVSAGRYGTARLWTLAGR